MKASKPQLLQLGEPLPRGESHSRLSQAKNRNSNKSQRIKAKASSHLPLPLQQNQAKRDIKSQLFLHRSSHRYDKSSLHVSKQSLDQSNQVNTLRTPSLSHRVDSVRNIKPKFVRREIRGMKQMSAEKLNPHKLLESFLCKSIQPSTSKARVQSKLAERFKSGRATAQNPKDDDNSFKQLPRKRDCSSVLTLQTTNQGFQTKLKKKCVQSNPHLLAMIIKRKHETLNKEQLYHFIKKIITKTSK